MPRYKIIEYRNVNFFGLSASGTSTISAQNLDNAKLNATCTNRPKGEWKEYNRIHICGEVEDGNLSIVIPLEDPEIIEYDIRLAFQKSTFRKSLVFKAFCDFLILSKTQQHMLAYTYTQFLKKKEK